MGYTLVFVCFFLIEITGNAQTIIASEFFDNSLTLFTQSGGTAIYKTGSSGTSDRPASVPFTTQGTHSWGISNYSSGAQLTSSAINTSNYSGVNLTFRLAAFSNGVTTNGLDGNDSVAVYISPDNGTTYFSTIHVSGYASANAYWGFSGTGAGTATASTPYDGNYSPLLFLPAAGGSRTTDGYSTVTITNLPSVTNLKVRIKVYNNSTSELWLLDNFQVIGTIMTPCISPLNAGSATITSSTGCASTNFTLNATGVSIGTGISYQWQSSPTGLAGTWTNISGANATSLATSASSTTFYQLLTTCSNDNSTNTTNSVPYTVTGSPCTCRTYSSNYANNTVDADITSVTVGSMTNVSACGAVVGTGGIAFRYSNYTGSVTGPTEQLGSVVNFSLTSNVCANSAYNNGFQVYIDWNQDGDFLDAGEQVYSASASVSGTHSETGSFVVPLTATLGTTRMRVVNVEISFPTTTNYAQSNYSWGETEDYCITLTAASACSGTPSPGNTIATPTTVSPGSNTTLTIQNATTGSGVTYQWYSSTTSATGPWTAIGTSVATLPQTPTSVNTWYYCEVTCAGSTGNSIPVQVTINYCTPSFPIVTEPICNVTFNSISNTSSCTTGGASYTNFTNISTTVVQGQSYTISVSGNTNGAYTDYIAVYIDFNQNGVFTDAGENFQIGTITNCVNCAVTGSITIPANALIGQTRMRIVKRYIQYGLSCNSSSSGEAEDYTLNIVASNSPNITVAGTLSSLTACFGSVSSSTSINVSGTNLTADITVNAPTGFEVSLSSATGYSSSVILNQTSGSVSSVTVYFRIAASAAVGSLTGNITLTSLGASTVTIAINGTVNALPSAVTVSPATSTIVSPATVNLTASGGTITSSISTTTIGTNNAGTPIGAKGNPYNCGTMGGSARNQWIILANELTSSGLQAGSQLSSLTFFINPAYGGTINQQTFRIAHTNASSFTSTNFLNETFTTVYSSPSNYSPLTGDVTTHSFTSNFTWNGTSNIVIDECHYMFAPSTANPVQSPDLQTYSTSFNSTLGVTDVVTWSSICNRPTGTIVSGRPVMRFNIGPIISPTWSWSPNITDNTASVTVGPTTTTTYTATATINGCSTSNTAIVNVNSNTPSCPNSSSITSSTAQSICQNATATQLTASYTTGGVTGTSTVQYQWYYNTTNSNTVSGATLIAGQTTNTFTPPSTTIGTRYYFCVVYASDNGCAQTNATQSLASNAVAVTIVDPATATSTITQGATASFCSGSSVTLNANTGAGLTYQWQLNGSPISGSISSTYAASAAGTYSVVVTGSGGCSATSSGTVVSSNPTPTITGNTPLCAGSSITLMANPAGQSYLWSPGGQTTQTINVTSSGNYAVTVTNSNNCSTVSNTTNVTNAISPSLIFLSPP